MAALEDLKKSISEMTDEELLEHVKSLRANRRATKVEKAVKKKTEKVAKEAGAKKTDIAALQTMLKNIDPARLEELKKKLAGGS